VLLYRMNISLYVLLDIFDYSCVRTLGKLLLLNKEIHNELLNKKYWLKFNFVKTVKLQNMNQILDYISNNNELCKYCMSDIGYKTAYSTIGCYSCMNTLDYRLIKRKDTKKRYMLSDMDIISLKQYYGRLNNKGRKEDLYSERDVIYVAIKVHRGIFNLEKLMRNL
jgi:hypothetical protein